VISPVLNKTKDVQWVDRGWYLVTEFEKTPSVNFRRAVELAKTHPGFIPLMDERNILIYRNIYRENELLLFQELYKFIKNWRGVKLYFKGAQVDFETIESGVLCYIRAKLLPGESTTSNSPKTCRSFNRENLETPLLLGCVGCWRSYISMEWEPFQSAEVPCWFFFGSLDQHKVYNINKEEMENVAIGHLSEYHSCPLLNLDRIRTFIQQLPDRIDPRKDKEWKYTKNNKKRQTEMRGEYRKDPDVLPISEEAYRAYLKRML
jgi:hypothetical protein